MRLARSYRAATLFLATVLVGCGGNHVTKPVEVDDNAPAADLINTENLASTIVFASTRHDPVVNPLIAAEIYLMDPGIPAAPLRLTNNTFADAFPVLSPDGTRIVFDSNRLRVEGEPLNTSDLFVMNADGAQQTLLTRGSSGSWSRTGDSVAFHASASGSALPIKSDPGAATFDSDIFILHVTSCIAYGSDCRALATNITNSRDDIDDDPDWSPDGKKLVYTSHQVTDNHVNSVTAEIYLHNLKTGKTKRLTENSEEERAPAWSPDGTRILYMCRKGGPDFELCVMDVETGTVQQLTDNGVADLTATWSPEGDRIVFHRPVSGRFQLFLMNADGTGLMQLTNTGGINAFANWGVLSVQQATIAR